MESVSNIQLELPNLISFSISSKGITMSVSKASFHLKCTNDFSYLISSLKPIRNNIYPFQLMSSVKTLKKIKIKTTDKERAKKAPNE